MIRYKAKIIIYKIHGITIKEPIIVISNLNNKRYVYSKINDFMHETYYNKEFNTKRHAAIRIGYFLNYCIFDEANEHRVRNISQLQIRNAERFINYLALEKKLCRVSLDKYIRLLNTFYIWLNKYDLLKNKIINIEYKKQVIRGKCVEYNQNLFKNIILGDNNRNRSLLHQIESEYLDLFLKVAYDECELIALGIYMQFFGGLRVGEVTSLKKSNVTYKGISKGLYVSIREDSSNDERGGSSHVKIERDAYVFSVLGVLDKIYNDHINRNYKNDSIYLFTNRAGDKLTGQMYNYYFLKVKSKFIDSIKDNFYGKYLEDCKWGTHIGRGTFSNMFSNFTNPNQLALLRGDKNIDSALFYIELSETEIQGINHILNNMYKHYQ